MLTDLDGVDTQSLKHLQVTAERSSSLARSGSGEGDAWLLINDFSISTMPVEDVLALFGGHKLPCLLFYSQACHLSPPIPRVLCFVGFDD